MVIRRWEAPDGRDRYIRMLSCLTGLRSRLRWMQTASEQGRLLVRDGLGKGRACRVASRGGRPYLRHELRTVLRPLAPPQTGIGYACGNGTRKLVGLIQLQGLG
jgi:hypothetical protein